MKNAWLFLNQMSIDASLIDSNTTVIVGFSGYGSVGTNVLNHIVEGLNVESIGFWGTLSWFHNGNLESPITLYQLEAKSDDPEEKFVLVTSRLPIPVVGHYALPDAFWKWITQEILSWQAKRYIIIGGLREDVRNSTDDSWVTLIPTKKYTELFGTNRTFRDDLSIKGPISFLLAEGTAYRYPVLSILSYCNTYEIDLDASLLALKELEKILHIDLESKEIREFDFSFLESSFDFVQDDTSFDEDYEEEYEEEYGEEFDEDFKNFDERNKSPNSNKKFSFNVNSFFSESKEERDDLEKYK